MRSMIEIRDALNRELNRIADKGEINETDLGHVDKITHSIKSIDTILAMKGYSDGYPHYYDPGSSYARRRDSMGRYSRESMRDKLQMMMDEAATEDEREALRAAMSRMH